MSKRIVVLLVMLTCLAISASLMAEPQSSAVRTAAFGEIDSLEPAGSGTAGDVKFTAITSFAGVGSGPTAEAHIITLVLLVIDQDGKLVATTTQSWNVNNEGQGAVKTPVAITKTVAAGVYFLNATLTDTGPDKKKVNLDIKSIGVLLK